MTVGGGVGIAGDIYSGGTYHGNIITSAGTIDNIPIGSSTPNTGAFTSLSASNGLSVTGGSISGVPGRLLNVQVFTSSGTYTPTSGTKSEIVEIVGGGGGSGGIASASSGQSAASAGGTAGSYAKVYLTSVSTQTITIGAAGTAGAVGNNNGGNGGTSSFGSIISCPGGGGGSGGAASSTAAFTGSAPALGIPCTISSGTTLVTITGQRGQQGAVTNPGTIGFPGMGGASPLGFTPIPAGSAQAGSGWGAGASGALNNAGGAAQGGAVGSSGVVIVYELGG